MSAADPRGGRWLVWAVGLIGVLGMAGPAVANTAFSPAKTLYTDTVNGARVDVCTSGTNWRFSSVVSTSNTQLVLNGVPSSLTVSLNTINAATDRYNNRVCLRLTLSVTGTYSNDWTLRVRFPSSTLRAIFGPAAHSFPITTTNSITVRAQNEPHEIALSSSTLNVTEGSTASYTVGLTSAPDGNVVVTVRRNNGAIVFKESGDASWATQKNLTFTTSNWAAKTIEVNGLHDPPGMHASGVSNDVTTLTHSIVPAQTSSDYDNAATQTLTVTKRDDDSALAISRGTGTLALTEGSSGTYTVRLRQQPTSAVTVRVSSGDSSVVTVNTPGGTAAVSQDLTFASTSWNTGQGITLTAVEDANGVEDTATITHAVRPGSSSEFVTAAVADTFMVRVTDNDPPGVVVAPMSFSLTEGEPSTGSGPYTVRLNTEPAGPVTLAVTSGDTSAVTVAPSSLTFSTTTWNTAQAVTASAVDDANGLGDTVTVTQTAASSDTSYNALTASVTVTVTDDDPPVRVQAPVTYAKELFADAADPTLSTGGTNTTVVLEYDFSTTGIGANATGDFAFTLRGGAEFATAATVANFTFASRNTAEAPTIAVQSGGGVGEATVTYRVTAAAALGDTHSTFTFTLPDLDNTAAVLGRSAAVSDPTAENAASELRLGVEVGNATGSTTFAAYGPEAFVVAASRYAFTMRQTYRTAATTAGVIDPADRRTLAGVADDTATVSIAGRSPDPRAVVLSTLQVTQVSGVVDAAGTALTPQTGDVLHVAVTGVFTEGDRLFFSPDALLAATEELTVTAGGTREGSAGLAAGPWTLYYVPDGATPIAQKLVAPVYTLDLQQASDGYHDQTLAPLPVTLLLAGVTHQGYAYAIPPPTAMDVGNVRIRCQEGVEKCEVYLDCKDARGNALGNGGDGTLPALRLRGGQQRTLQSHRLSGTNSLTETLGVSGWSGRISCNILATEVIGVQVLTRSNGVLVNNTYVGGRLMNK